MLDIRPLRIEEIPQALRLSDQAGWNQLTADWRRMLQLWPEWCLAGRESGQLIATSTLAVYDGSLGWVGMVLVDEAQRGKGVGGAILNRLIQLADQRGVSRLGLDATDAGRPVYLKRGFADVAEIARWTGPAQALSPRLEPAVPAISLGEDDWRDLLALDRACAQIDRSSLLKQLAAEPAALLATTRDGGQRLAGAGFARAGREAAFIGPVIAGSQEIAGALLARLLSAIHDRMGPTRVLVDVPAHGWLEPSLQQSGFQVQRRLTRMVRDGHAGDTAPLADPRLVAAAGFELG